MQQGELPKNPLADMVNYVCGLEDVNEMLVVKEAPEPREVNWEALELTDEHERKVYMGGTLLLTLIVLIGAVSLLAIKMLQAVYRINGADDPPLIQLAYSNGLTLAVTAVTFAFNTVIRLVTEYYVAWEGQDTHTQAEASTFNKLSIGLCMNSVFVPLLVAVVLSNGNVGDQTYYEPGGLISTMMLLIVCNYSTDLLFAFNIGAIAGKYILSAFAFSQRKLRMLWKPQPVEIGSSYSYCLVLFALGLIYGPLYPLAYLLTAVGLALKWLCTRFGMRHWYGIPPTVDQEMMLSFRWRLGNVFGIALIVQCLAVAQAAGPDNYLETGLYLSVGGTFLLLTYTLVPLGYFEAFATFDQLTEVESLDTDCSFDEASKKNGVPLPHYVCPALAAPQDKKTLQVAMEAVKNGPYLASLNLPLRQAASAEIAANNIATILSEFGYKPSELSSGRQADENTPLIFNLFNSKV